MDRWWGLVPVSLRVHKVNLGLHKAARNRHLFHLWFHPFNLATNPGKLVRGLEDIFIKFCSYRDAGLLDNFTMGELAYSLQTNSGQEAKVS
jgi:hypothetical protein